MSDETFPTPEKMLDRLKRAVLGWGFSTLLQIEPLRGDAPAAWTSDALHVTAIRP